MAASSGFGLDRWQAFPPSSSARMRRPISARAVSACSGGQQAARQIAVDLGELVAIDRQIIRLARPRLVPARQQRQQQQRRPPARSGRQPDRDRDAHVPRREPPAGGAALRAQRRRVASCRDRAPARGRSARRRRRRAAGSAPARSTTARCRPRTADAAARNRRSGSGYRRSTCSFVSPAFRRSRTSTRRSCARSASESSIDWLRHTRQRNSWPMSRARASSAGSASISSGRTAWAGAAATIEDRARPGAARINDSSGAERSEAYSARSRYAERDGGIVACAPRNDGDSRDLHFSSFAISGRIFWSRSAWVSGPTCL